MSENKKDMNTVQQIRELISQLPQKPLLVISLTLTLSLVGFELAIPHLTRLTLNALLQTDRALFTGYAMLFIPLFIGETLFRFFRQKSIGHYTENGCAHLRLKITDHISRLPIGALESKHSGDYVSRLTNDVEKIRRFTTTTLIQIIYRPLMAIVAFIYLCTLDWKMTLIATFGAPLLLAGAAILSQPMGKYSKEVQENLALVNSVAQDSIRGAEVARAFDIHSQLDASYSEAVVASVNSRKRVLKRQSLLIDFQVLFGLLPFILVMAIGGRQVVAGNMDLGALGAFIMLLNHLTMPVAEFPGLMGNAKDQLAGASRLWEILDIVPERTNGQVFSPEADTIVTFDNVSFNYKEHTQNEDDPLVYEDVLNRCSFTLEKGETVAIVGPSGSGKSTLFKLLLGYYDDYDGDISMFGQPLKYWRLPDLRQNFAWVGQDTFLFPTTMKENIGFGCPHADETSIIAAAKAANAHDFIMELPRGYDTNAGELGGRLSGGQKQRIAIARAICKDAPLLLLDEATSSLDTQSEALVQEALDSFMYDRTALVIAHRLSTIKNAHRILVLDKGQIVEQGTHETLLNQGGLYHKLYFQELANREKPAKEVG